MIDRIPSSCHHAKASMIDLWSSAAAEPVPRRCRSRIANADARDVYVVRRRNDGIHASEALPTVQASVAPMVMCRIMIA